MNARTHITTATLALAGAALWFVAGNGLRDAGGFDYQPNPLGIKRSPYGEVLAMAIQGPVDQDFHMILAPGDLPSLPSEAGADTHQADCASGSCNHSHHASGPIDQDAPLIDKLASITGRRTNPNPPTPGHQLYLRSKIENRLRFAYELGPSHYGNYNSYHLFLTEPQLGTETTVEEFFEGRERADRLAEYTIRYCLADQSDPRPALTAATAAYNVLESMCFRPEEHSLDELREQLGLIDSCLDRHRRLLDRSTENGTWDLLSPLRQKELLDRAKFTRVLRDTAAPTLDRLSRERSATANHPSS